MEPEAYVRKFFPIAKPICDAHGINTVGCLAQMAQESGWGEKHGGASNIYFGIKPWKKSQVISDHPTHEVVDGKTIQIEASFVAWPSVSAAIEGYCDFIRENSRYAAALKHQYSWRNYLPAVAKAGYATDPFYLKRCVAHATIIEKHAYELGFITKK